MTRPTSTAGSPTPPVLEARGLTKRYAGQPTDALRGVSLGVWAGEWLVVMGASGGGKTTLLHLLAGLETPDAGTVLFNGMPLPSPADQLVRGHPAIRLASQDHRLAPSLSVEDNIYQSLKGYQPAYQRYRAETLLAACGLLAMRTRLPRQLSGGQQQRLVLARALADEPPALLLDEPFGNLDNLTKAPLLRAIREATRDTRTAVVLATHDSREALALAHRVAVLQDGRLRQLGPPRTVYQRPANAYAAHLLGPANILSVSQLRVHLALPPALANSRLVCIRPEAIVPADPDQSDPTGLLAGVATEVRFAGAFDAVTLQLAPDLAVTLHAPVGQLRAGQRVTARITAFHPLGK